MILISNPNLILDFKPQLILCLSIITFFANTNIPTFFCSALYQLTQDVYIHGIHGKSYVFSTLSWKSWKSWKNHGKIMEIGQKSWKTSWKMDLGQDLERIKKSELLFFPEAVF